MYNVIVNPTANDNRVSAVVKKVVKYLKRQNIEFLVFFAESLDDLTSTTKKLCKNGEKDFIVIGGDGTLHHFVNSLIDPSKTNFGIIPAGKHNHFAKYLNIPTKPIDAIKNILEHPAIKIDYLKCNQYRALNLISCGAIEQAEKNYINQDESVKKQSFNRILNLTLQEYKGIHLTIQTDESSLKESVYTAFAVCNGGFYGDNIYVSPLSNMHDGLANVIALEFNSESPIKNEFKMVKNGHHIYINPTSNSWTSSATITSPSALDTMMDGELYSFDKLEINVISHGLNIYTKK